MVGEAAADAVAGMHLICDPGSDKYDAVLQ